MEPPVSPVTLGAESLERSLALCRDGLDLPTDGIEQDVVVFALQGAWLRLYGCSSLKRAVGLGPRPEGFGGITNAPNVRTREEVERAGRRRGAPHPTAEPHWDGADPDEHVREIAWNPQFWIE